jgi:hypothetical protein
MTQKHITAGFTLAIIALAIIFNTLTTVYAADESPEQIKKLSGISIVGNKEAPKSLYIIPWQKTELTHSAKHSSELINNTMQPLDADSFRLQLELHKLSNTNRYKLIP